MPLYSKGRSILRQPVTENKITLISGVLASAVRGQQIQRLELKLPSVAVTMTDGTTNGSIGSKQLITLNSKYFGLLGASVSLPVLAAANITATATLKASIGTAAEATNDTLDGVQANIMPSTSLVLVSSAGTLVGNGNVALAVDGTAGTQGVFLNLGVADAGSSGNSTVTITNGTIVLFLFEMN